MKSLLHFTDEQNVGGLVLGWPINMDGSTGPRCDSVRDFAHELIKIRDFPIVFQDERLSSKVVETAMIAANINRARRAKRRDELAACWILQSFLDYLRDHHISKEGWHRSCE